jgi:hypothetical protein
VRISVCPDGENTEQGKIKKVNEEDIGEEGLRSKED